MSQNTHQISQVLFPFKWVNSKISSTASWLATMIIRIKNKNERQTRKVGRCSIDNKKCKGRTRNEQKDKKRSSISLHLFVNAVSATNLTTETFLVHSSLSDIFGTNCTQRVKNEVFSRNFSVLSTKGHYYLQDITPKDLPSSS